MCMKDLETLYEQLMCERNWLLGIATAAALSNASAQNPENSNLDKNGVSDTVTLNRMLGDRDKEIKNLKDVIKSIEEYVVSIDKEVESLKKAISRFNNTKDQYQVSLAMKYRDKIIELTTQKQKALNKRTSFIEELKKYANVNK